MNDATTFFSINQQCNSRKIHVYMCKPFASPFQKLVFIYIMTTFIVMIMIRMMEIYIY